MDDRELIGRVLAGDPGAERALYDAHVDRVFRLVYRMVGDLDRAQDYVQETFIRAFQRLADFRGESRPVDLALLDRDLGHAERAAAGCKRAREREVALDEAPAIGQSAGGGRAGPQGPAERRRSTACPRGTGRCS